MQTHISVLRKWWACWGSGIAVLSLILFQASFSWSQEMPTVQPYGYAELDTVYSDRNTNPLDPAQFNGYATAAGLGNGGDSTTFNPRFSVIGLKATQNVGENKLSGKVEADFYGSAIGNPSPRLRLAFVDWARGDNRLTVGQDWTPVASLNPSILDFSIAGYTGNLWQRIPQITDRYRFGKNWEALVSIMRFERGQTVSYPAGATPFNDPVKTPILGARLAYDGWGQGGAGLVALSGTWRQFSVSGVLPQNTINSEFVSGELAVPVTQALKWSTEVSAGQAIGDEFFRFGQALNGNTPIRFTAGFSELSYAPNPDWSFASGYGFDNANKDDLGGLSGEAVGVHYKFNQRYYANATRAITGNFKVGAEYQKLATQWANGVNLEGSQFMLSFFYGFWL